MNDKYIYLVSHQKFKLLLWGGLIAISGFGFIFTKWIAYFFSIDVFVVNLSAMGLSFISVAGASLSVRCPQCKLSLVWYGLSRKNINEWLAWVLQVKQCPRCGCSRNNNREERGG